MNIVLIGMRGVGKTTYPDAVPERKRSASYPGSVIN